MRLFALATMKVCTLLNAAEAPKPLTVHECPGSSTADAMLSECIDIISYFDIWSTCSFTANTGFKYYDLSTACVIHSFIHSFIHCLAQHAPSTTDFAQNITTLGDHIAITDEEAALKFVSLES